MKTLICVLLLALHALAKGNKADYKQLTNSIAGSNPTVEVSTLDPTRSAATNQATEHNPFPELANYPNADRNRILLPHQAIDHNLESLPVRDQISFGVERFNQNAEPHHFPAPVQRAYPVPVAHSAVENVRYSSVPYPLEKITSSYRQVPYPFYYSQNRPVFIPGSGTHPILVERRVAYPTERIVYQPVRTSHNFPPQNPVPVQVLHPRPVSYEPQYFRGVTKQYPYESEIPNPHLVPARIPYYAPNKNLPIPVRITNSGTNYEHRIASNDYPIFLANHNGPIGYGRAKCDADAIPTGSFISNSGAISLDDYYAAHKLPDSNPQLEPQHLDYFRFSSSSENAKLAEPTVDFRKSLEFSVPSVLPKTDVVNKSPTQTDLKIRRS